MFRVGSLLLMNITLISGNSTCDERLVSGANGISDEMITASSYYGVGFEPWNGRLSSQNGHSGSKGSWAAAINDSDPFIQVQFRSVKIVTGVVTLPRDNTIEYVMQYRVQFKEQRDHKWMYVTKEDRILNFIDDRPDLHSETIKKFPRKVHARFVRIKPDHRNGFSFLRFDVLGCPSDSLTGACFVDQKRFNGYYLSGSRRVLNHQITASSYSGPYLEPWSGRISNTFDKGNFGWSSGKNDEQPFIQVNFWDSVTIACITTKPTISGFVRSYHVMYKDDEKIWKTLKDTLGNPKILPGNADANQGAVNTSLPYLLKAKAIRIVPVSYERKVSMYFDFIGEILKEKTNHAVIDELCRIGDTPCNIQLVSGIPDRFITASSYFGASYAPSSARYNSSNGWAPNDIDKKQYIQVEFMNTSNVKCILTRKHATRSEHVRTYAVQISSDGKSWDKILDQENNTQIFIGNDGMNTHLGIGILPNPVKIRYIRILPLTFHLRKTIRFEILGCSGQETISKNAEMSLTVPQNEDDGTSIEKSIKTTIETGNLGKVTLSTSTAIPVAACNCSCVASDTNLSIGSNTLKTRLNALVKSVKIQKNATAQKMRSKMSAVDERTSSKTMGTVGVCFILVVFSFAVLLDIQNIYKDLVWK